MSTAISGTSLSSPHIAALMQVTSCLHEPIDRWGKREMVRFSIARVLLCCLWSFSSAALACDLNAAHTSIESIREQLSASKIERLDVRRIPDHVNTFIAVRREDFESYSQVQDPSILMQRSLILTERKRLKLAGVFRRLEVAETSMSPDLRWEIVLRDRSGNSLHSIFLDKPYLFTWGRRGYIDGNLCWFSSSLIDWLERQFPSTWRSPDERSDIRDLYYRSLHIAALMQATDRHRK